MSDNQVIRGDTKIWSLALVDASNNPYNLSGCTIWFTAKTTVSNVMDDADAIIQHKIIINGGGTATFSDGFVIGGTHPVTGLPATGAASGVLTQTLTAAESTLLATGNLIYDLQVLAADGTIHTPINGLMLTVLQDVTRSAS